MDYTKFPKFVEHSGMKAFLTSGSLKEHISELGPELLKQLRAKKGIVVVFFDKKTSSFAERLDTGIAMTELTCELSKLNLEKLSEIFVPQVTEQLSEWMKKPGNSSSTSPSKNSPNRL